MSSHTPGPWSADDGDGQFYGVFDDDGNPLAFLIEPKPNGSESLLPKDDTEAIRGYRRWEEHQANARLMATAPELLAALKAICSEFAQQHPLIVAGRNAIAKAEGKSP